MASLVEELINVLAEEENIYKKLTEYGEKKRQIIIDADIPELEKLTDLEQQASDELLTKSNKQIALLGDIATVLGKTDEKMTVTRLIGYLDKQPDIQSKLTETRDSLLDTADQMQHGWRRDALLRLDAIRSDALQETEVLQKWMVLRKVQLVHDSDGFRLWLKALEGYGKVLGFDFLSAGQSPEKVHVPEGTAVFTVGDSLEANVFLLLY